MKCLFGDNIFSHDVLMLCFSGFPRTVRMALFVFYLLTSIVVLNLFIGIVTDVYPGARSKSYKDWDDQVQGRFQGVSTTVIRMCVLKK